MPVDRTKEPIDQEWIKKQIDTLINVAKEYPERSAMRSAILLRASVLLDLVESWRKR